MEVEKQISGFQELKIMGKVRINTWNTGDF